jgi:hypothetical protein
VRRPRVWDDAGRPVPLGARLGRGGEGSVFAVIGDGARVAKVYHRLPPPERASKLATMVRLRSDPLLALAAWPLATLHSGPGGAVRGLLLPRAEGRPIHILYGPKSRLAEFPAAGWDFLVATAANLARAFAVVHEHGQVIGDVNHGNALVSGRGTVRLIDCDSFQITAGSHRFLCEVGVGTHVPPELQGAPLGVPRTANHDAFGLAVLVFQLLFLGRHPFSGRFLGPGDLPIERAIREHRFAYGREAAARRMRPPPGVPALEAASPAVAELFERAFAPAGGEPAGRPDARRWEAALAELARRLRGCGSASGHRFWNGLAACPWCEAEELAGAWLFPAGAGGAGASGVSASEAAGGSAAGAEWMGAPGRPGAGAAGAPGRAFRESTTPFALRTAWARITAVPPPGPPPPLGSQPSARTPPSRRAVRAQLARTVARALEIGLLGGVSCAALAVLDDGWGFAVMVFVILAGGSLGLLADLAWKRALSADLRAAVQEAARRLRELETSWRTEASGAPFEAALRELEEKRRDYLRLAAARRAGTRDRGDFGGIGGIGAMGAMGATGDLGDPRAARLRLQRELLDAPRRLWEIRRRIAGLRRTLPPQFAAVRRDLAQAEADLRAVGG